MYYSLKNILTTSALALVLSLSHVNWCSAQGVVSLNDNAKANSADEIPDEISLFGDDDSDLKVITPAKSASAAKASGVSSSKTTTKTTKTVAVKTTKEVLSPAKTVAGSDEMKLLSAADSANEKQATPQNKAGDVKAALDKPSDGKASQSANALMKQVAENTVSQDGEKATEKAAPAAAPAIQIKPFDNNLLKSAEDSVFDKMSDLEKQTAILNLELKKEKVKNDIESLKAIQEKAREEEQDRIDEKKRKIQAWENEEKRKILQEQQKLKNLEIVFEQTRQEELLKGYKNEMLKQVQNNIASREPLYKEIASLKEEREQLVNDFKGRFIQLTQMADEATNNAIRTRDQYAKTISDLQTQISILTARLEASEKQNPFSDGAGGEAEKAKEIKLSDLYAVMEVRGQGNVMTAKLINESGIPFLVKVGTALQSGHVVDEITPTYVRADKDGNKSYLYFSAGGILDKEPEQNEDLKIKVTPNSAPAEKKPAPAVLSNGIPGMASEMVIR